MDNDIREELKDACITKNTKIGDELIVLGKHVRIDAMEVIFHTRRIVDGKPTRLRGKIIVPISDFVTPFPKDREE